MAFPNFKNKHAQDSIFSVKEHMNYMRKFGRYPKIKVPRGVIFCYDRGLLDYLIQQHKARPVKGWKHLYSLPKKNIYVVAGFGVGSPYSVSKLEEMISIGAKKFISIGVAGALQKGIKFGDIVVCNRAIRDEGTSYHYLKPSKYVLPSNKMVEKICVHLDKNNIPYHLGTTWTLDAFYRETVAEAKKYQKEKVLTVDMEASALFAVAQYRKIDIGVIFIVSDSLAELEWKPGFKHERTSSGLEKLYSIALEVLH